MLKKIKNQPFLQFLLIGICIFILHSVANPNSSSISESSKIIITSEINEFIHRKTQNILSEKNIDTDKASQEYQREFFKVRDSFIQDEILYLEALSMGLDKNDPVIKRRLTTKAKILAAEQASVEEVNNTEIENYYTNNLSGFSWPIKIDIWQLFYSKQRHPKSYKEQCFFAWHSIKSTENLDLEGLASKAYPSSRFRMNMRFIDEFQFKKIYGTQAEKVFSGDTSEGWIAPILTEEGCHLINITKIHPGGTHELSEVQSEIASLLEKERNERAISDFYEKIKKRYYVVDKFDAENAD